MTVQAHEAESLLVAKNPVQMTNYTPTAGYSLRKTKHGM
jgi:hypothetical protein